jgi:cold shock CspA family protein
MMMTGVIKRLVKNKGFGFIRAASGTDYFFHRSGLDRRLDFEALNEGAHVTFDESDSGGRGPRATNVDLAA